MEIEESVVGFPTEIYILNFHNIFFSFVSRSSQLGGVHANEIKQDHTPVVYLVFRPQLRLIIQGLFHECVLFRKVKKDNYDFFVMYSFS